MPKSEYLVSLALALCMLGGLMAWTHVTARKSQHAWFCQSGKALAPVVLKGMNIYKCPAPAQRRS